MLCVCAADNTKGLLYAPKTLQSLAIKPVAVGFDTPLSEASLSLLSESHPRGGGTSTAGEQLKNPCGCAKQK